MGFQIILFLSVLTSPATAIDIQGDVQLITPNGQKPVHRFMKIPAGSTLTTGEQSHLNLRFESGSQLRLGPKSKIVLSEIKQQAQAGKRVEKIRLLFGRVWARVMKLLGDDAAFEIKTQHAVAGVRGTAFWAESTPSYDAFSVDRGSISLNRKDTAPLQLSGQGARCVASPTGISKASPLSFRDIQRLRKNVGGSTAAVIDRMRSVTRGKTRRISSTEIDNPKRIAEDQIDNPTPEEELGKLRNRKAKIKIQIKGI